MPTTQTILPVLLLLLSMGCTAAHQPANPDNANIVFIVTGVGGAVGYQGLVNAMENQTHRIEVVQWGSPIVFLNFSSKMVHDLAEKQLADKMDDWQKAHPTGRIDLVGHSAGGGVVLGALPRLQHARVNTVVLLAPSVSPTYDLTEPLRRIDGTIDVFYSNLDTTFLDWRTSHFGTYDRIKAKAAGNQGFSGEYPSDKLKQFAYDPKWKDLGNDGGHFGSISERFAKQVIAPLLGP